MKARAFFLVVYTETRYRPETSVYTVVVSSLFTRRTNSCILNVIRFGEKARAGIIYYLLKVASHYRFLL